MSDAAPAVVMPQTEPAADTEAADTEASAAAEAGGVPTGIEAGAGADEWAQTVADGLARKPGDGACCVTVARGPVACVMWGAALECCI